MATATKSKKQRKQEAVDDLAAVKKNKAKKAKSKGNRVAVTPPPEPPKTIGKIENPLFTGKGMKRALVVAIAIKCGGNMDKTALAVRASGIPWRSNPKDETEKHLYRNEWSGRSYAKFGVDNMEEYPKKSDNNKEKVDACLPFAVMLLKKVAVDEKDAKSKDQSKKDDE